MLDYLQKYKNLPESLKKKISSEDIMNSIRDLEKEYGISLAVVIMKVMVKGISIVDLPKFFVFEHRLDGGRANKLVEELKEKVFYNVFQYLNIEEQKKEESLENEAMSQEDEKEKEAQNKKSTGDDDIKFVSDKEQDEQEKFSAPMQASNFFFSPEDEDEIKELTKKLEDFPKAKTEASKSDNAKKIESIIKESNLSFSSEEMSQRFRKIVDIYLKKIRNRIDTKQTMMKSVESGGLGINDAAAVKILDICDKISSSSEGGDALVKKQEDDSQEMNDTEKNTESSESEVESSENTTNEKTKEQKDFDILKEVGKISGGDADYDFDKLSSAKAEDSDAKKIVKENDVENNNQKNKEDKIQQKNNLIVEADDDFSSLQKDKNEEKKEAPPNDGMVLDLSRKDKLNSEKKRAEISGDKQGVREKSGKIEISNDKLGEKAENEKANNTQNKIQEQEEFKNRPQNVKIKRRMQPSSSAGDGKIKMEDVKYVPKALGPIEELEEMNLVDFRRLSQDPKEATKKIEEKIKYLEDDRYARRIQGIRAWRKSPVNTLYLNMGQESIIVGRGIENAIKTREKTGKDFLSLEEFNAIMELNKRIRY